MKVSPSMAKLAENGHTRTEAPENSPRAGAQPARPAPSLFRALKLTTAWGLGKRAAATTEKYMPSTERTSNRTSGRKNSIKMSHVPLARTGSQYIETRRNSSTILGGMAGLADSLGIGKGMSRVQEEHLETMRKEADQVGALHVDLSPPSCV
jgi:hypothetical protein